MCFNGCVLFAAIMGQAIKSKKAGWVTPATTKQHSSRTNGEEVKTQAETENWYGNRIYTYSITNIEYTQHSAIYVYATYNTHNG